MIYQDGSLYDGMWLEGIMHGQGVKRSIAGEVWEGWWDNGEPME